MAVGSQPENFGILDARWTGQSIELSIRHFNSHGHPYALLSVDRTRDLILMLDRAIAFSGKQPVEPDAADFEF